MLNNSSVRLVILNACKIGIFVTRLLRGMAPALMNAKIPAVVAMQSSVQDDAGLAFVEEFYRSLVGGTAIDDCVAKGRKAVIACGLNNLDWGLAALYMRLPNGVLFDGLDVQNEPPPANIGVNEGSVNLSGNFSFGNVIIAGMGINQVNTTTFVNNATLAGGNVQSGSTATERREHLKTLRTILKERLYDLELQEEKFGKLYAPPYLPINSMIPAPNSLSSKQSFSN
jgi:hypothetical protein